MADAEDEPATVLAEDHTPVADAQPEAGWAPSRPAGAAHPREGAPPRRRSLAHGRIEPVEVASPGPRSGPGPATLDGMTTGERLHELVDQLPEERLADVLLALAPLNDEHLTDEDRAAIEEAEADAHSEWCISSTRSSHSTVLFPPPQGG